MSSEDDREAGRPGEISAADREAFKRRASALEQKLREARGADEPGETDARGSTSSANGKAMGRALRLSTELIGGIIVGSGLGWLFDQLLGTWPAMFIVFFLLGSAAGMLNLIRSASKIKTGPSDPSKGPAVAYDDEDDR
jgi:ATP synthase protein I